MSNQKKLSSKSSFFPNPNQDDRDRYEQFGERFLKKTIDDIEISIENNKQSLLEIQNKLHNSAALNGGFDTLMNNVKKIEEFQTTMLSKIDSIHEAIYHPDNGLFSRVKTVEVTKTDEVNNLEKEIFELKLWKENEEKIKEKEDINDAEREKLIMLHDEGLKDVIEFKEKLSSIFKWVLVSAGTGFLGVVGKIVYDFISGHIQFV